MKKNILVMLTALMMIAMVGCNKGFDKDYFLVTEDFMNGYGTEWSSAYVMKNDKFYSICDAVDQKSYEKYGLGWNRTDNNVTAAYSEMDNGHLFMFPGIERFPTCDNVNDKIYTRDGGSLTLVRVNCTGYTLPISYMEDQFCYIEDLASPNYTVLGCSNMVVYNSKGEVVEDIYRLEEGKKYSVEITLTDGNVKRIDDICANCKCFELIEGSEIELSVLASTPDGGSIYDTANVHGTYFCKESFGLVEID